MENLLELGFAEDQIKAVEELLNTQAKQIRESIKKREDVVNKSDYDVMSLKAETLENEKLLHDFSEKDKKIVGSLLNRDEYKELDKIERIKKIKEDFNIESISGVVDAGSVIQSLLKNTNELKANKLETIKKYGAKSDQDIELYAKSLKWE